MSKFETINGKKYRRKVRAVIINENNEFLLIQPHGYRADMWTLVGGGIEDGETPEIALSRELQEEIGINVFLKAIPSNQQHSFLFKPEQKLKRGLDHDGQKAYLFIVQVDSGLKIKIQESEIQAFVWAQREDLKTLMTAPKQFEVVENLMNEISDQIHAA